MEMAGRIDCKGELGAVLIRGDGSRKDFGILQPRKWHENTMGKLTVLFGAALLGGVVYSALTGDWSWLFLSGMSFGIVTTAGVNYMASDFASGGASPTISGFKYHDSGVGTTAAAVGDTDIETTDGESRVAGTPTNPAANQYRSVATISYTTTKAITEWGLFSASSAGTLWDRRVFSAINVVNGDSIQFTYTLTVNNGGS